MGEIRHRKRGKIVSTAGNNKKTEVHADSSKFVDHAKLYLNFVWICIGLFIMLYVSYKHSWLMYTIHENNLWFTNIREVEREISFRTESGLYYSYFKQSVAEKSFLNSLSKLIHDNLTEAPSEINVLNRMNIYQEVFLAAIYRFSPYISTSFKPILFYVISIFSLQGLLISSLFLMAWTLSNCWLGGLLASLFYIFNKTDTTRVAYVVPLRESFSLPFLWLQLLTITIYLKTDAERLQRNYPLRLTCLTAILLSTFLLTITWQFGQFLLLLEALPLFGLCLLNGIPRYKTCNIFYAMLFSLILVYILMFGNNMIIGSLVFSFLITAVLIISFVNPANHCHNVISKLILVFVFCILSVIASLLLNVVIKVSVGLEADEHIFKFLRDKFSGSVPRDFDARLYLCLSIFQTISYDVFERLFQGFVLIIYGPAHVILLLWFTAETLKLLSQKPENRNAEFSSGNCSHNPLVSAWFYNSMQCLFFGALACTTLRMKYTWTPYMCVLAGASLSSAEFWSFSFKTIKCSQRFVSPIRIGLCLALCGSLLMTKVPVISNELEQLQEFWDPDTVDLMNWINEKTHKQSVFSGSMQLMAGVKCCTERPISNHPHYEDKSLRERTRELYQYYGKRSPREVHEILTRYKVDYIILEDSICIIPRKDGCRTVDTVDIDNGHTTDFNMPKMDGLTESKYPRFCDAIRYRNGKHLTDYERLFELVFENKTFRVYRVK